MTNCNRLTRTALILGLVLAAALTVLAPPASAQGKHGPVAWGSLTPACTYRGQTLARIAVTPPKASMDKALARRGGTAQYVGLRSTLQGLKGSTWQTVTKRPAKGGYAATVLVHPRRKSSLKHPGLLAFTKLPATYSSFRIVVTVQWYAYDGRHVRGQVSKTSAACSRAKAAAPPHVQQIQAGSGYACALMSDTSLRCWGYNGSGRVGNASSTNTGTPVTPVGMTTGVRSFSISTGTTCAMQTYVLKCWGRNDFGQVGDGTTTGRSTPTVVQGFGSAYLAFGGAGSNTVCGKTAAELKCWGENKSGSVGNGGTADVAVTAPYTLSGVGGVTTASTGNGFACAASPTVVWCWGSNTSGQMGTAPSSGVHTATTLAAVPGASSITAGSAFACAIVANAALKCWGANTSGQIGTGSTATTSLPVSPAGLGSGVTSVSAASASACAVKAGAVYCWGDNAYGQLGIGSTSSFSTPQHVPGISGAIGVVTGGTASYAWDAAGHVWAWGQNVYGQLADGTTTDRTSPVAVTIH